MVNAVGIAFAGMLTAIFAGIGFYLFNSVACSTIIDNCGETGLSGLWTLFPILFPFIAIGAIILGIYAMYRYYAE